MHHHRSEKGFIAVISAIIISGILMFFAASAGLYSIYSRSNLLDSELKERSDAAAEACADSALLQLAQGSDPSGTSMTINSLDTCTVGTVTSGSNYTFKVQGISSNSAYTNLRIVADAGDLSIIAWEEVAN